MAFARSEAIPRLPRYGIDEVVTTVLTTIRIGIAAKSSANGMAHQISRRAELYECANPAWAPDGQNDLVQVRLTDDAARRAFHITSEFFSA